MADHISLILDNARDHVNEIFASVACEMRHECERMGHAQQEQSKSAEMKTERSSSPDDITLPAKERFRTGTLDVRNRHCCESVKILERKLQKVKHDRVMTISQEWHKAHRLREQDQQLLSLRDAFSQQEAQIRHEQELAAQTTVENDILRQELNEIRRDAQLCETSSKQKLADAQHQIDVGRTCWQNELKTEKKKRQRTEKNLERLRKRQKTRLLGIQRETDLLKADFCDQEDQLEKAHVNLQQAKSSLMRQSESLTEKDHEISRLLSVIAASKDSHEREQQQLHNELSVAQKNTYLARDSLTAVSDDLEGARQTLNTMQASIDSFSADNGAVCVMRQICQHLRRFAPEPHKFCDATHGEFRFITHCGVLLCSDCLERTVRDKDKLMNGGQSSSFFELDCSWCLSSYWTWERLTIPFVSTWQDRLEELSRCLEGWTANTIRSVS